MNKFQLKDKHVAFCNDVASGKEKFQAFIDHISINKKSSKASAAVNASKLLARPEIQECIARCRAAREAEITGVAVRNIDPVFKSLVLSVDEMDAYHSAVIQGMVEVEEVVPVYNTTYDKNGKVLSKTTSFMRVKRPPNIREKQISIDALFKRRGAYAPVKSLNAFKTFGDNDNGEIEEMERYIIFSNGEKMLMPKS